MLCCGNLHRLALVVHTLFVGVTRSVRPPERGAHSSRHGKTRKSVGIYRIGKMEARTLDTITPELHQAKKGLAENR